MAKQNNVKLKITAKNKTQAAFNSVTKGLRGIAGAAFSMKSAVGLAAGVAGLGYLTKQSLNATDQLGKTAQKIGVTTDALGGLRYAAELTGVAANTMDMAMQRMTRRISEAAMGSGEAKDALKELGLSAKALNDMSPDQAFMFIADAMEKVAGQSDRVRLAMRLFDSEGVALVNTMAGGSKAIADMHNEAARLGLLINGDLVNGVEAANDAITRLTSFMGGTFHRIVAELAPLISDVTDGLRGWFEFKVSEHGGIGKLAKQMAIGVVEASQSIVTAFGAITNSIINLSNSASSFATYLNGWFGDMATSEARKEIAELDKQIQAIHAHNNNPNNKGIGIGLAGTLSDLEKAKSKLESLISQGKTFTEGAPIMPINVQPAMAALDALLMKLKTVHIGSQEIVGAKTGDNSAKRKEWGENAKQANADKLAAGYAHLRNVTKLYDAEVAADKKAWDNKLATAYESYGYFRSMAEDNAVDTRSAFEKAADGIQDAYKSMQSSVESTLTDLMVSGGNWKDAMMSILDEVYREFVRVQIAAPIAEAGNTFLKETFDNYFAGTRANGGPVQAGSSYIVGENGPEVFTPREGGSVAANSGGQPVHITYNIKSWDSRDTMAALQGSAPQIVGIVREAFNKGGVSVPMRA